MWSRNKNLKKVRWIYQRLLKSMALVEILSGGASVQIRPVLSPIPNYDPGPEAPLFTRELRGPSAHTIKIKYGFLSSIELPTMYDVLVA